MFGLGVPEVALILIVGIVFLGPKKLPELARGLGQGIREFRKVFRETEKEISQSVNGAE